VEAYSYTLFQLLDARCIEIFVTQPVRLKFLAGLLADRSTGRLSAFSQIFVRCCYIVNKHNLKARVEH